MFSYTSFEDICVGRDNNNMVQNVLFKLYMYINKIAVFAIVAQCGIHLPSPQIIVKVVNSISTHVNVHSIHLYVITIVSTMRQFGRFLRILCGFPPPTRLTAITYLLYCQKWRDTYKSHKPYIYLIQCVRHIPRITFISFIVELLENHEILWEQANQTCLNMIA